MGAGEWAQAHLCAVCCVLCAAIGAQVRIGVGTVRVSAFEISEYSKKIASVTFQRLHIARYLARDIHGEIRSLFHKPLMVKNSLKNITLNDLSHDLIDEGQGLCRALPPSSGLRVDSVLDRALEAKSSSSQAA
ncbi:hypothetical protein PPACK8108_LOCUS12203 [Phakopsora pachyrhizi]|uniref:Uncharacterized protein n=1 Tax=Phakopsora pachyrhizi TaxID=170000 RepID=A0AAV0B3G7_PHAPC|nr:hypothetical protein PPACK8108_LOCUS12203 [Phakopsora pachyrhizi]